MTRICRHLEIVNGDYAKFFSGLGLEYALVCKACREAPASIESNLRAVSAERFRQVEEEGWWVWDKDAILGRPEVLVRPTELSFQHEEFASVGPVAGEVAEVKPIPSSRGGECVVLLTDGSLFRVDPVLGSAHRLLNVLEVGIALDPKWSLHVSARGEMATVVEARGRYGVVLDLESGRSTMRLDRQDYYPEETEFPVAFFESNDRLRLIHGTDWNRLDVSDPWTGETLTPRSSTSSSSHEERPDHDLNYFHGGLAVSPGGRFVADNGWVWHPVGVVTSWNLPRWLEANVWESEDGPSRRDLCDRGYFWNGPLCWIDDRSLAIWGYGTDDENLIPAAQVFDVESGRLLRWFAGPVGSLTFDRYLFSSTADAGTSVWDVMTGERLLHDSSFHPTCYHPGAKRFVTLIPGGGFRFTRLVGGGGPLENKASA